MGKRAIALVAILLISSGFAGAYYVFNVPPSPHLGVVSQQNLSKILNASVETISNITSTNYPPTLHLPNNATNVYGKLYYIPKGPLYGTLVIISYHFNSTSQADKYYDNASSGFVSSGKASNNTFRGFTFTWYGNASGLVPFLATGVDGSYSFLVTSFTYMSSNRTDAESLIHHQIDSML